MPVLDVPYFTQPDATHCQSACLKMMAAYLEAQSGQPVQHRNIGTIKETINGDPNRPVTAYQNHWDNFRWWLEQQFPSLTFTKKVTADEADAMSTIKTSIAARSPVIVSTTHTATSGHIILVVGVLAAGLFGGYREPSLAPIGEELVFVCHDPYGAFDPQLGDHRHGAKRYEGGYSMADGEHGPGKGVILDIAGIRRSRPNSPHSQDAFLLIHRN